MPDDGWVRMYHPDQYDEVPDPDDPDHDLRWSLVTRDSFEKVWIPRGWVDVDAARAEHAEAVENMPEAANERIAWMGEVDDDPVRVQRAKAVLSDELDRGTGARTTVVSAAENILDAEETSEEDQTNLTDDGT